MSETIVSVERVKSVVAHPNADRLDIIQVLGYNVITQKGNFVEGDLAIYFPPDVLIGTEVAVKLGVQNYLKHAVFPGDVEKTQCRVGATRLRGIPSHGFCVSITDSDVPGGLRHQGADVTGVYDAHKYVAPVRVGGGNSASELDNFAKYTNIENIQRYPDAIPNGTQVVITEKIHGTNCRMGLIKIDDDFQFVAGSHNVRRKQGTEEVPSLYWQFMSEEMMTLLTNLCNGGCCDDTPCHDVVVYSEIFGPGVQDMTYGQTVKDIRVFDISVNGIYMDYDDMIQQCQGAGVLWVPELARGPYSAELVEEHTYGDTVFNKVTCKFKGREGCVVRPLVETFSEVLGKRMILKSVSADYRDRKGATDDE